MTYSNLLENLSSYRPALFLDLIIFKVVRGILRKLVYVVVVLSGIFYVISLIVELPVPDIYIKIISGLFYVALGIALPLFSIEAFYRSIYFKDASSTLPEENIKNSDISGNYVLADILSKTDEDDLTVSFLATPFGAMISMRLGIGDEAISQFTGRRKLPFAADRVDIDLNSRKPAEVAY